MTRFAIWSSIGPPKKMTLSLSRREYMSYARSPKLDFSITVGINIIVCVMSAWVYYPKVNCLAKRNRLVSTFDALSIATSAR